MRTDPPCHSPTSELEIRLNGGARFWPVGARPYKPTEVVTDAAAYPAVPGELTPSAWHHVEQYANSPIEADHSQLKQRACGRCEGCKLIERHR